MKKLILLALGLGPVLLVPAASAQILPGSTNIADRVGQVILPERVLPETASAGTMSHRPPRLDIRPELPQEIKSRIARFEESREKYLARQQELMRKLNRATGTERELIRKQLQQLRDEWLERARSFREEAKTRLRELQDVLPRYRDALIDAKEGALDQIHKRRGDGDR